MADLTFQVTINAEDLFYLQDRLTDPEAWIRDAIAGQIGYCKKRCHRQWIPQLLERGQSITREGLTVMIQSQPDYKNRQQRYVEEEQAMTFFPA